MTLGVFVFAIAVVPQPAHAQLPVTDALIGGILTGDIITKSVEKSTWDAILTAAKVGLVNAANSFFKKLAYDSAIYVASGGSGQKPQLFTSDWDSYLADAGKHAVGGVLDELGDQWGVDFCAPSQGALMKLDISLGIKKELGSVKPIGEPEPPKCTFDEFVNNAEAFAEKYETTEAILGQVGVQFESGENDLATAFTIYERTIEEVLSVEKAEEDERKTSGGFKDMAGKVAGNIATPGSFIQKEALSNVPSEQNKQTQEQVNAMSVTDSLQYILVNTGVVFLNTLGTTMMNKLIDEGFIAADQLLSGDDEESLISETGSLSYGGRQAAELAYADLLTPTIATGGDINLLNEFAACPQKFKQPNHCVVDQQFVLAVKSIQQGEPLTIKQAMDKGLLHGDWKLYPPNHEQNSSFNCYNSGYCYSNLKKLRRARIIPVGFELAAEQSPKQNPWQLAQVVNGFNECADTGGRDEDHPFCHLIDPNWVLKAPPMRCNAQAFTQTLQGEGGNSRSEACVDVQDCPRTDANGNCLGAWGYCIAEKNSWNLKADQCPAQFAGCEVYKSRTGKQTGFISTTIDHSVCDASNVGCRRFITMQSTNSDTKELEWMNRTWEYDEETGELLGASKVVENSSHTALNITKEFNQPFSPSIHLNEKGTKTQCQSSDKGCTRIVREDNSELHIQVAPDYLRCYDYDTITSGIQLPVTIEQAQEISARKGCSEYAPVCAEEEVGCQMYNAARNSTSVTGIATLGDRCPSECVGYDTYKQESTNFESSNFPLYFIPESAEACSFAAIGCDEFTNLDEQAAGGEGLEYYSFVRACEKPGANVPNFYTWEGTEASGYQIQLHHLKAGGDGMPQYNVSNPTKIAEYESECNVATYGADPDCREIYDEDGKVAYRLLSKTITISEDCHPLRRSGATQTDCDENGGTFTNGVCIYNAIPSESTSCQAQFAGCRAYQGKGGADQIMVIEQDFEGGMPEEIHNAENNAEIAAESLLVGGHSLKIFDNAGINYSFDAEVGATYMISFWAKGTGTVDPGLKIFLENFGSVSPSPRFADDNVNETARKLTTTWKRYAFGPVQIPEGIDMKSANFFFDIENDTSDTFIDNIELTQGDFYALKKDTWKTPVTCDTDPSDNIPGAHLGCELYTDTEKNSHTLKSFSNLCREEAIGCENVIDTRNTDQEGAVEYNTANEDTLGTKNIDPNDNIIIGPDRVLRMVLKKDNLCSVAAAGCQAMGEVKVVDNKIEIGDVYLINNPSNYNQTLCQAEAQGCDAFTSKRGVSYFKDPLATGRVCEFRESASVADADEVGGINFKPPSGWFKLKSADDETEGDIPCSPSFKQSGNRFGIWKSTDPKFYEDNPEGAYTGVCSQKMDQCFELVDETDRDAKGKTTSYYVIDNKKLDRTSCQGKASRQEGCAIFNDTREPNKLYSAKKAYLASEDQFGALVNAADFPADFKTLNGFCSTEAINAVLSPPSGGVGSADHEDLICKGLGAASDESVQGTYCEFVGGKYKIKKELEKQLFHEGFFVDLDKGYVFECNKALAASNTIIKVKRDRQCAQWMSPNSFTTVPNAPEGRQKQVTGLGLCQGIVKDKAGVVQCADWIDPLDSSQYGKLMNAERYSKRHVEYTDNEISGLWQSNSLPPFQYHIFADENSDSFVGAGFDNAFFSDKSDSCFEKVDGTACGAGTVDGKCYRGKCTTAINSKSFDFQKVQDVGVSCRGFPEKTSPFPAKGANWDNVYVGNNGFKLYNTEPLSIKQQKYAEVGFCQKGDECSCNYQKATYASKIKTVYREINETPPRGVCLGGFHGGSADNAKSKTGEVCGDGVHTCRDERSGLKDPLGDPDDVENDAKPLRADGICQFKDRNVQKYRGWQGYCLEHDKRVRVEDDDMTYACSSWLPIDQATGILDIYNQFESAGYQIPEESGRLWCTQSQGKMSKTAEVMSDIPGVFEDAKNAVGKSVHTYRSEGVFSYVDNHEGEDTYQEAGAFWDSSLVGGHDGSTDMFHSGYDLSNVETDFLSQNIHPDNLDGIIVEVIDRWGNDGAEELPPPGYEFFIGAEKNQKRCYYGGGLGEQFKLMCTNDVKGKTILKKEVAGLSGGLFTERFVNDDGSEDWVLLFAEVDSPFKHVFGTLAHSADPVNGNPWIEGGALSPEGFPLGYSKARETGDLDHDCDHMFGQGGADDGNDKMIGGVRIHFEGSQLSMRNFLCKSDDDNSWSWHVKITFVFREMCKQIVQVVGEDEESFPGEERVFAFTQRMWDEHASNPNASYYDRDISGKFSVAGVGYEDFATPYGSLGTASKDPTELGIPLYTMAHDLDSFKEGDEVGILEEHVVDESSGFHGTGHSFSCTFGNCGEYPETHAPGLKTTKTREGALSQLNKLFAKFSNYVANGVSNWNFSGYSEEPSIIPHPNLSDYDIRLSEGRPPRIASLDESEALSSGAFKLRKMNAFNVNEEDGGIIYGVDNLNSTVRFAAWADTDQMPLRRLFVDWGDGSSKAGGARAKYKNKKPYCGTSDDVVSYCNQPIDKPNLTCRGADDCNFEGAGFAVGSCNQDKLVLGNHEDGCAEGYFEYNHVYSYSKTCGVGEEQISNSIVDDVYPKHIVMTSGILNSPEYESLKALNVRVGDTLCIFKPKVQVQDNWGWCNGACQEGENGVSGCFDSGGLIGGENCNPATPEPWTGFDGEIIVVADE